MKTLSRKSFIILAFSLAGALVLTSIQIAASHFLSRDQELPVYHKVRNFSFLDTSGKVVTREALAGKVWIADFIFTRCAGPCPLMTAGMKRLQDRLHEPDLRLVSFTVDPGYDTPEVLKAYGKKFGADLGRWLFLTGPKDEIYRLSREDFLLGAVEDSKENENPIIHSTRYVLVDGEGNIRGYYNSTEPGSFDRLLRDTKKLLTESGRR